MNDTEKLDLIKDALIDFKERKFNEATLIAIVIMVVLDMDNKPTPEDFEWLETRLNEGRK